MAARLVPIEREECLRRLSRGGVGRAGLSAGALPAIFPVNYAMLDGDVVFRSGPGTKLEAAEAGEVIAFEIDDVDPVGHTGWSVLVVGVARPITEPQLLERARHLPLSAWADGQRDTYVRLECAKVTGRELTVAAPV
jgi:uncharacterized protein